MALHSRITAQNGRREMHGATRDIQEQKLAPSLQHTYKTWYKSHGANPINNNTGLKHQGQLPRALERRASSQSTTGSGEGGAREDTLFTAAVPASIQR